LNKSERRRQRSQEVLPGKKEQSSIPHAENSLECNKISWFFIEMNDIWLKFLNDCCESSISMKMEMSIHAHWEESSIVSCRVEWFIWERSAGFTPYRRNYEQ
jgi:hypothetical protein